MNLILLTPPAQQQDEHALLNRLFEEGLPCLHIRKPGWETETVRAYIESIPAIWRDRIMVHGHPDLVVELGLRGAHIRAGSALPNVGEEQLLSAPVHEFGEILALEGKRDYVLLSPVFDSLSKPDYPSRFSLPECRAFFEQYKGTLEIIALGGIEAGKIAPLAKAGFHGVAVLGAIWQVLATAGIDAALATFQRIQTEAAASRKRPFPQRVRLK